MAKDNGIVETVFLNNLEVIGKLVESPKKGHKTGNYPGSWDKAIKQQRKREKSHWVWINTKIIGKQKTYEEKAAIAKASGGNISGILDTAISVFMEFVRSTKCNFQYTYLQVNDQTEELRLRLNFTRDGLHIPYYYDMGTNDIGFVCARKSYET